MENENKIYRLLKLPEGETYGLANMYAIQFGDGWVKCKIKPNGKTWLVHMAHVREQIEKSIYVDDNFMVEESVLRLVEDPEAQVVREPCKTTVDDAISMLCGRLSDIAQAIRTSGMPTDEDSSIRRDVVSQLTLAVAYNGQILRQDEYKLVAAKVDGNVHAFNYDEESHSLFYLVGPLIAYAIPLPEDVEPPNLDSPKSPIK